MSALPLTIEELDAIRALNAKRTPGRWQIGYHGMERTVDDANGVSFVLMDGGYMDQEEADAEFIAAAPDAIERLLAEVDAYRAKEKEAADKAAEFERSREQRYTCLARQLKGSDIEKDNDYLSNWVRENMAKAIHKTFGTSGDLPPSDNEKHEVIE